MSKNAMDSLYQMILKGLNVLFALFKNVGVLGEGFDISKFFEEMNKPEDAETEAE